MTKKEYQDKYDEFMLNKEQYLADLGKLMGISEFTFVKEEIEKVDDFFRLNKEKFNDEKPQYGEFENYYYAYLGIAYITKYGGEWAFNDQGSQMSFGTPVLMNEANYYRVAPFDWMDIVTLDSDERLSFFYRLDKLVHHGIDDD